MTRFDVGSSRPSPRHVTPNVLVDLRCHHRTHQTGEDAGTVAAAYDSGQSCVVCTPITVIRHHPSHPAKNRANEIELD